MRKIKFDEHFGRLGAVDPKNEDDRPKIMATLEIISCDVLANVYELWLENDTATAFKEVNRMKNRRLRNVKYAFEIDEDLAAQIPKNFGI